jgi:hypothetical protein
MRPDPPPPHSSENNFSENQGGSHQDLFFATSYGMALCAIYCLDPLSELSLVVLSELLRDVSRRRYERCADYLATYTIR